MWIKVGDLWINTDKLIRFSVVKIDNTPLKSKITYQIMFIFDDGYEEVLVVSENDYKTIIMELNKLLNTKIVVDNLEDTELV